MSRHPFKRRRDGLVEVRLDPPAVQLLTGVLAELQELLDEGLPDTAAPSDPLVAALGIGVLTEPPTDPALARLLPDAYSDDPAASGEFRRYTELGLRDRKRAALRTVVAGLEGEAPVLLDPGGLLAWLSALNDARLALGARLDIEEDWPDQVAGMPEDDPRLYSFAVYEYLTELQDLLLHAAGDPPASPRASRA